MRHDTSIYIKKKLHQRIKALAFELDRSMNQVVIDMLREARPYSNNELVNNQTVKYQERIGSSHYRTFHLRLKSEDYELFTDMRNMKKESVSFQLALAFWRFLKRLTQKPAKKIKKLYFEMYATAILNNYSIIMVEKTEKKVGWRINWLL